MDIEKLENFKKQSVLVYGDFMLDRYIEGSVNRISPEAPVPVILVNDTKYKLGGAGNVVNNLVALGTNVHVLGFIGNDHNGEMLAEILKDLKVSTKNLIVDKNIDTIVKTRVVSKNHQFLRYDDELRKVEFDAVREELISKVDDMIKDISVVIVSDYNKGSIDKEFLQVMIQVAKEKGIPVFVDPKGKDFSKYKGATICTPNTAELEESSNVKIVDENQFNKASIDLLNSIELEHLIVTRSEKGMSLFSSSDKNQYDFPTVVKEVVDVTGAGDTVVSILALLYASGFTTSECCKIANVAASIVVSKFGASTVTLNELISALVNIGDFKHVDIETAQYIVNDLKEKGKKVVFTNGSYDIIHAGHIKSFKDAKAFGDVLIVAVNTDASVKRYKGPKRPIINEMNRVATLEAIEYIDYIVLMDDDEPSNLIRTLKPDITVKGMDWVDKNPPEKEVIESIGGKMEFISMEDGLSTTNIITKIIEEYVDERK